MRESHALLIEGTNTFSPVSNIKDMTLYESKDGNPEKAKLKVKARVQTADKKNQNKRVYKKDICKQIVETMRPKALGRCLFQEVDHPMIFSANTDDQKRRAVIIELKNCGSLISDIYMEGDEIIAIIETLSGFLGPDLRRLITEDKADIGLKESSLN